MCIYVYKYERSADKRNRCVALSLFSWHRNWILSGCMPDKARIYPSLSSHTILLPALCPVQLEGFTFQTMWAATAKEPWFSSTWTRGCAGNPVAIRITAPSCAPASLQLRTLPAMQLLQPCRAAETPLIPWRQSAQVWRPHIFLPHIFFNFLNLHY